MNKTTPEFSQEVSLSLPSRNEDFSIEPGLILRAGPTVFRVKEIRDEIVTLEHSVTFERRVILLSRLLAEIASGKILPGAPGDEARAINGDLFEEDEHKIITRLPLDEFSDAQREHVRRLMRYIRGLRDIGYDKLTPKQPTIQLDLDRLQKKFNDPKPVKAAWVYKWSLVLDRANGDPRALIPHYDKRGGAGKMRLDPLVQEAIMRVIAGLKGDNKARIRTIDIVKDVKAILEIEQPNRPDLTLGLTWSTVDRQVKEHFTAYEVCKRTYGKTIANKKFRNWYPRDRAEHSLEVLEVDDTDTGVFMIDEKSGLPYGRGYLTGGIDQRAYILLGYELSNTPRSVWSAINALVNAIMPKDLSHPDFAETRTGCEFYGKPGIVVFDNALYNHANEIEDVAHSVGFIPAWAKPKTPTEKRNIEDYNGRLKNEFLPDLPGFRGDKKFREGLKEGLVSANVGLLEFRQAFNKWNYDILANTPGSDGLTSRQRWHMDMRQAKPRLPRDVYGLKLVPCLHKTLKLRQGNIMFGGIVYYAHFLHMFAKQYGHNAEVRFRFNPNDIGEIYAFDPRLNTYIPIPATNPEYARGLTLYQHRLICKMAREKKVRNPSVPQMLVFREQLRVLTEQLRYSKKLKDRKRSARTGDVPDADETSSKQSKTPDETVIVTDLEDQMIHINEIEMDTEDEGWQIPIV